MTLQINYVAHVREHYHRYGFVTWSQAAKDMGCSRQNVWIHLDRAVASGRLSKEEHAKWRSSYLSSPKRSLKMTEENFDWLNELAEAEGRTIHEVLNALLNKERQTGTGLAGW